MQKTINLPFNLIVWPFVAILLASPLLFYFTGTEWLYPPPYTLDSFANYAYVHFMDDPQYKHDIYKASRVPWIAPLFWLTQLVGPKFVNPAVNIIGSIALPSAFFVLIWNMFGKQRAITILPWIVFYPHLVGVNTGGATYHGIGANLYFVLGLIFWVLPKRRFWNIILSGTFIGSALHCSPIYLNLLPLLPFLKYQKKENFSLSTYTLFSLGIIIVTLLWGWVNYSYGKPFFFMGPQLEIFLNLFNSDLHQRYSIHNPLLLFQTSGEGYRPGHYLVPYFGAFFFALFSLSRDFSRKKTFTFPINYNVLFCCYILYWLTWQLLGTSTLDMPDFVYPLQIVLFLVLASWIEVKTIEKKDLFILLEISLLLWGVTFFAPVIQIRTQLPLPYISLILIGIMAISLGLIHLAKSGPSQWRLTGLLMGVFIYSQIIQDSRLDAVEKCHVRRNVHDAILDVVHSASQYAPPHQIFWLYNFSKKVDYLGNKNCPYHYSFRPDDIGYFSQLIIGYALKPELPMFEEKDIAGLERSDFEDAFLAKVPKVLAISPSVSSTFRPAIEKKMKEFGLKFELIGKHHEYIYHYDLPFYFYRIDNKYDSTPL